MIIDVSTPADNGCNGPLRGTTAVYFPPGVPARADVEWRILAGEQPIRTGIAPVNSDVVTIGFDLRNDELPPDGLLRVDARARSSGGTVGEYGKPWNFRVSRDCRPLHVVSVGDSVMWGQGLDGDRKFAHLTADALTRQTGRTAQVHDYSASGAALDAPEMHPTGDDSLCAEGEGTTPDVFCQLARAGSEAASGGYDVDLVLLDGCINDLDPLFGIPVGVTPGTQDLTAAVRRECAGLGAEPVNPAANLPYFSGAKLGYGGRGMQAAIGKAHALPGGPKVMVANYFYGFETDNMPETLLQRWSEFVRSSAEVFRQAAMAANSVAGEQFAVAADGLFAQGGKPGDAELWMNPLGNEAASLRLLACPQLSELPPQCRTVAAGDPDVEGARRYADAFLMNPKVREWFGDGGPADGGFSVSSSTAAVGKDVSFDAAQAGGAIRHYEWYFGDGEREITTEPVVSHAYSGRGPNLPRLVVTDMTGRRSLYELDHPITVG
ncbi:PKD domain-containing protein [Nocardia jejuensis]|uniref:PKD domain-containing protein n=1 Tax=Nocardia jejuensis TaxID=328049 RepID=UPI0012F891EB|nr:PKD domain-containing protein [Nocardia jejuensis]